MIKKFLLSTALCAGVSSAALAQDGEVRIGVLFGFTGPIASMAPVIAETAELALREASKSDAFLNGRKIVPVRADSTCVNRNAAVAAAERLVKQENAVAFVGAGCSGAASAVLVNVARPHGILSISPTATSPGLTDMEDGGLFFRTAPSDARQGEVLAELLIEKNIRKIALTYTDNDYGSGLTGSFTNAFEDRGGKVLISEAHMDGKVDYAAEVATLAASGADILMVAGYADQGGRAIVQTSLDTGAFDRFVLPDGMVSESMIEEFGAALGQSIGTLPGSDNDRATSFAQILEKNGITEQAPFRAEAYDAAAVLTLAMQAAGTTDGKAVAEMIPHVANAPGIEIGPGEIAKGMFILSQGGAIDYVGASAVEFTPEGDAHGTYREVTFSEDGFETVRIW
ncbi:branched-chain amino acid transport system substrate-binding protein [Labrenzia sp. EL_208]|nr:branched-chain amino acid transport system substrate-binding protein [Labrenzia sp. EL_132]MBG6229213.1 branched-chain amino acid transport system substrate-binding protein [Labrenzia sp. EL_208]